MKTDPKRMDELSKNAFAPIYPLIARQIVSATGIKKGVCIDLGTGPAALSIALAKITDLKIYSLDIEKEMCKLAEKNIFQEGLSEVIDVVQADVHNIPYRNNFADLVVSRGSIPFWKDLSTAFKEIYRILKPEGTAYVGGGFGSLHLKNEIIKKLEDDEYFPKNFPPKINVEKLESTIIKSAIKNYTIKNDDSGLWILIEKD
ncbi:MAG: class I SAM-dependent methyltransferase [Methanobacteriaceae archaeon]|jgi:ubiquinone/menaquinone biosynthesis C-methylase UbiE|nr:class I SAM-dependent methyltransferase [Methanobacteriaceae archaeon]OPY23147.1 MAG: arsenite S-adenosylmethyltransferase [Methanobacterium sp. PtaU1.Bin097]